MEVTSSHVELFLYKQSAAKYHAEEIELAEAPLTAAGETQVSYRSAGWRAQCQPALHY